MTRWFIAAALVWGLFMMPSLTSAQSNASGLETAEWRFIDGVLEAQKQNHHFAGAVVVVVSDGHIVFEKGYGFADYVERAPVDAQRTLFRIASNTKMFVDGGKPTAARSGNGEPS
jgi:CubicO group peptidase (beta-lactamase class C family)